MGRAIPLTNPQICRYATGNPWHQPLGRLAEYLEEFTIPPVSYARSEASRLVSLIGIERHVRIIDETTPFLRLGKGAQLRLSARSCLPASTDIDADLCSLLDFRGWHSRYYHWFLDCLPRLLAAEHHRQLTGRPCTLLVPDRLTAWQSESLHRLGYGHSEQLLRHASRLHTNIRTPCLIALSSHRHQHANQAPFDALSPATIRQLVSRISPDTERTVNQDLPRRIFITRTQATSRRLINAEVISGHLSSRGFTTIDLQGMSLAEQIALFRNASHVIAIHGAALTNLLYCQQASVLEIFSLRHGVRPDYFQIACINNLNYCHYICPSLNDSNDIELAPEVVDAFLDVSQ